MSIVMGMQNFIKIYQKVQEIGPVSLFSEFEPRQNLDQSQISLVTSCQYQCVCKISSHYSPQFRRYGHFHFFRIWSSAKPRPIKNVSSQSLGLDLVSINVYAKVYQYIPLNSRDRAIFTFSDFGARQASTAKPRPMINVILQFLGLDLFNIKLSAKFYQNIPNGLRVNSNGYAKFYKNIPKGSRDRASFTFFRIWTSAKPRPIPNVIWQSHGLDLVNTNVYAKFHHNIPLRSKDSAIFTFQNLELGKASIDEKWHFTISWARSCQYQCLRSSKSIKIFHSVKEIRPFHFFRIWRSAKPRLTIWGTSCQYQCVCKISSQYSTQFKR